MAEYLTDGNWIITTQRKLVFSLVCQEKEGETREIEVQPPLDVIMLPMTCSASNEYVTLMPYYEKESKFQVEDSISELLLNARVANTTIWKPFHEKLPDFSAIELPDRLQAVEQIPLKRLIAELSGQGELVEDTVGSHPAWSYAGVGTLVLVMVLIVVIYKCKGRCPGRSARWRGGGRTSGAAAEVPGMQMVSVTTTRDCAAARSRLRSTLHRRPNPGHCPSPDSRGGGSNASAPVPKLRERSASLSVDLAHSNNEAATATAFQGLRRLWLGPSGRDVLCQPAQGGRHPDPVTRMTLSLFL